mmetsp:Transcript_55500/g.118230  ORF Transcript_55500/g.118230 Transcript_55500/m.118230 type:complete len:161 (-) Transcript_55500:233-715(-)|eukprot:CAMPEP_0206430122 /NCGR_PEP_ID=MMETSP0324_2-20121206/6636_1 /ASSEMBLY_ACC=CAM_ASM_000836 /TAXON_ID=2866 /ORGANISM="Crypthecodinium cohnii, Strain Seligo" /LENGTH=160 /DNA_ID=CAMNT_0053895909 /DNA_START=70 /DNA_END=552 /DNA_ORIENTATION=-
MATVWGSGPGPNHRPRPFVLAEPMLSRWTHTCKQELSLRGASTRRIEDYMARPRPLQGCETAEVAMQREQRRQEALRASMTRTSAPFSQTSRPAWRVNTDISEFATETPLDLADIARRKRNVLLAGSKEAKMREIWGDDFDTFQKTLKPHKSAPNFRTTR